MNINEITIVIVSYYRGDRLRRCIETLKDVPNIIVWDNKTTGEELDKIKKIEQDYLNIKFIYSEENYGIPKAWNQGIIQSKTDWVLLTCDDMLFDSDWFDVLNDILIEKPHLEQIHLNAWNAIVFHKKTIARMGWWDERYRYYPSMEDDDWYLRTVEKLGYSPYGGIAGHFNFTQQYKEVLLPFIQNRKNLFDRADNFTFYCNSDYSKHKVIGLSTITGQEDDAGSRNNNIGSLESKTEMTGVQFHHIKWTPINNIMEIYNPHTLLAKDGRMWVRAEEDVDFYPDIRQEYAEKYFNMSVEDLQIKPISFIIPSRNNLKYLKWCYSALRKNISNIHEICIADDFSIDGTDEWIKEIQKTDNRVKFIRNEGPTRLGHTILYDRLINEVATNDIVMIFHADMYVCPNMDKEITKYIAPKTVVSLTRIEPPLHPQGPEKIIADYGIEPEEFNEEKFITEYSKFKSFKTTDGIFAPWAILKEDFQFIGGHDNLFAPQSKEDSDIFNRFALNGYRFIQTWNGHVYHMTCRGSRFKDGAKRNPNGEVFMNGRESDEWLKQNMRSTRNFIRKWGSMVEHDSLLKPIIPPKYDIGFVVKNCSQEALHMLEPFCNTIYTDCDVTTYIKFEQPNTKYNLSDRVKSINDEKTNDIIVAFDAQLLNQSRFDFIYKLPKIIRKSAKIGMMKYDIFVLNIKSLETYEKTLINL